MPAHVQLTTQKVIDAAAICVESSLAITCRGWGEVGEWEVQLYTICIAVDTGEVSFNDVKQLADVDREQRGI